ncbi:MAG: PDZ domain-containing protein [Propionibacteriaceae bacterium]|nr:PDZ domain-containing protein [Propionibacteriaceae bacterium]
MTSTAAQAPSLGLHRRSRRVTAVLAGSLLAVALVLLVVWPTPYMIWATGGQANVLVGPNGGAAITVRGITPQPVNGTLLVSSVTEQAPRAGLPQLLAGYIAGGHDVFPLEVSQLGVSEPSGTSDDSQLAPWQRNAVVAALRAAGYQPAQAAIVSSVVVGGPAYTLLDVNDIVTAVDGTPVSSAAAVADAIAKRSPSQTIQFDILRGDVAYDDIEVTSQAANDDPTATVVGASFANTFTFAPADVRFNLAPAANDPTSGLMIALGLYDMLQPNDVLRGWTVSGIGEVDPSGAVSTQPVVGVHERATAAVDAGAKIFFVPDTACSIAAAFSGQMTVVQVANLSDVIADLGLLATDPKSPQVHYC